MKAAFHLVGWCLSLGVLAGCAVTDTGRPMPAGPIISSDGRDVLGYLSYFQSLVAMSNDELKRELASATMAYHREASESNRLRLATILSLPGSPYRDDAKALNLLEHSQAALQPLDNARRQYITLLQRMATERLRVVREERRSDNSARDARDEVRRLEGDGKRLEAENRRLEIQLRDEQRRADELQKKLDGLLAVEREISRRAPQKRAQ